MDNIKLAELLFPAVTATREDYEKIYPQRDLPEGAMVTRIGPSPTGFVHLGNLYNALIGERLAHQSGGVFFLRVEDTDQKREVEGAVEQVIDSMDFFNINFDEGATITGDNGSYGPYRQRQRAAVYHAVAKYLVQIGRAYPCFCAEEELTAMREAQGAEKANFGYYGKWAKCRELTLEEIAANIEAGKPYVLRFRSHGTGENDITVFDAIRGDLVIQENYQDFVLLKSDGIPTYHFAHVVDDHLMRTTHVVRGEEWLATLPMHVECFDTLGWKRPVFCHTAQLMKMDGDVKRKLSKRKDPELALSYYRSEGYLPDAIWEYLLTVLNSNFEEWRIANPDADRKEFPFTAEKMSNSGTLFDIVKLNDISKEVLIKMPAEAIYEELLAWAESYDAEFAALLKADKDYACRIIDLGRDGDRPRKDLVYWAQAAKFLSFYYKDRFQLEDAFPAMDDELRREILRRYLATVDFADDNSAWFDKVKVICSDLGFALQPKLYKKNPELYPGSIADVSNVIRVAVTGRSNSPDLWQICKLIGEAEMRRRCEAAINM